MLRPKIFIDGKPCYIEHEILALQTEIMQKTRNKPAIFALDCSGGLHFFIAYYALYYSHHKIVILKNSNLKIIPEQIPVSFFILDRNGSLEVHAAEKIQASIPSELSSYKVIVQTSGSTGSPKYVGWTREGIDYQSHATSKRLEYTKKDCLAVIMPFFSAYALSLINISLYQDIPILFTTSIEPQDVIRACMASNATTIDALPFFYESLLEYRNTPLFTNILKQIRAWNCGGDMLDQTFAKAWFDQFKFPLLDGYGLSEAGPNVAISGPNCFRLGTVGKALEGTELKLSPHGELLVKNPSIASRYLGKIDKRIVDENGWLNTGDIAQIDAEGFITILGRSNLITNSVSTV